VSMSYINKKTKIYIVGEYHPTNLSRMSFLCIDSLVKEVESLKDKLLEQLYLRRKVDTKIIEDIYKSIEELLECERMLLCAEEIREREFEYIDQFTNSLNGKIVLYLEGNSEVNIDRSEIVELAKRKNLKLVYLDEGNVRYEKLLDGKGKPLKNVNEVQVGREDYWIKRIEETIEDAEYAIAVVGINHVGRDKGDFLRKIYKKLSPRHRHIGYFDKKLKEKGYDVEVIEITC